MAEHRRPSCAALVGSARSTAAASIRRRSSALQRMGLAPTKQRRTAGEAASTEPFEHYKFDGEESSMHLEWRARQGKGHQRMIRTVQECLVWLLGVGLGLLVGSMTIASRVNPAPCPSCPAQVHPASALPPARNPRYALICPHLPSPTLTCPHLPSPPSSPSSHSPALICPRLPHLPALRRCITW